MLGTISFCLILTVSPGLSLPAQDVPNVGPEVLDALLQDKQYEMFSKLLKIPNVKLVIPNEAERSTDPMFNEDIEFGDMLIAPQQQEEARQGIRFEKYGGSKWKNGYVPFIITSDFNDDERNTILNAVNRWNQRVSCIKWYYRNDEEDYVFFFKGDGCYSYLGCIGGQQPLSLGNGCVYEYIAHHEMDHAIGFAHEQNRHDRDNYVEVLWGNIPERWQSQYKKTDPNDYGLQSRYDCYSIMHYGPTAPDSGGKDAFRFKSSVDRKAIGGHRGFTDTDLEKIRIQYC